MDQEAFNCFEISPVLEKECLKYLPVKCLSRFKLVCKNWKAQISTEEFQQEESQFFTKVSGYFFQEPERNNAESQNTFASLEPMAYGIPDFIPKNLVVKASSQGLLCICRNLFATHEYYISAPARRFMQKLPSPQIHHTAESKGVLLYDSSSRSYRLMTSVPKKTAQGIGYWKKDTDKLILGVDMENGKLSYVIALPLEKSGIVGVLSNRLSVVNISYQEGCDGLDIHAYDQEKRNWEPFLRISSTALDKFAFPFRLLKIDQRNILYHVQDYIFDFDITTGEVIFLGFLLSTL
ncbi:F-box domain containing protein [Parasponia andersonii]|uniref:F-box domain containing protein n=1 Tax=Parasponia andersonii TaxID=3476 RepID=A0A2P5DDZ9_PARAD|nr:F-box domain containing protein [Parasponia andersonii]